MSYDGTKPADDEFVADAPEIIRENMRALKEDRMVDAGKLVGLSPGNDNGNIAVANGTVVSGLNADKVDGKDAGSFAVVSHTHSAATASSNGFMSNTDKAKLDGIAEGAQVNQNAFSNVKVGSSTIAADSVTDTLTLTAGTNIKLTPSTSGDSVTVAVSGTVTSAASAANANELGGKSLSYITGLIGGKVASSEVSASAAADKIPRAGLDGKIASGYLPVIKSVLSGSVFAWPSSDVPDGYLECDGSAISRMAYADLYGVIGTTFGEGDGSVTFNIPDLRGEFVRGWDHGRGIDVGRALGSHQDDQSNRVDSFAGYGWERSPLHGSADIPDDGWSDYVETGKDGHSYYHIRMHGNGKETRPRNVAMMYIIKY